MPRMLRRAALLGTTAHIASKRGAASAQAGAPPEAPAPVEAPPVAPAPEQVAPATPVDYAQLTKLKELLDAGILTQEEFDTEKAKVLSA